MANKRSKPSSWVPAVIVLAAIVAAGAWMVRRAMQPNETARPVAAAPQAVAASAMAPAHTASMPPPIHEVGAPASASTAPLPALHESDDSVIAGLSALGGDGLKSLLVSPQLVARIVATVDALPRHALGSSFILPLRTPRGSFRTSETQGIVTADTHNAERYAPYMAVVRHADPQALVRWYVRHYPLFQQAWRELGYPRGEFNERLLATIDDMLAAPTLAQPPALRLENSRYVYVDPTLEARSVGQKLLLRLGPADAAELKGKLRVIRALLAAWKPQASATP